MPRLTVQPVPERDFARVGALCAEAYVAGDVIPADDDYAATLSDVAARAREALVLAAYDGDQPVGSVTLAPAGSAYAEVARDGEIELRMLAVAPSAQGRGVGITLVRSAVETAAQRGYEALVLTSTEDPAVAARRYRAAGFERAPERDWTPHWYDPPPGEPRTVPVWAIRLARAARNAPR